MKRKYNWKRSLSILCLLLLCLSLLSPKFSDKTLTFSSAKNIFTEGRQQTEEHTKLSILTSTPPSISPRPDRRAWSHYKTYSRETFVKNFPSAADESSLARTKVDSITALLPGIPYIATAKNMFAKLDSAKEKKILNTIRDFLIVNTSCIGIQISEKYAAVKQGNQWIWIPQGNYDIVYLYSSYD